MLQSCESKGCEPGTDGHVFHHGDVWAISLLEYVRRLERQIDDVCVISLLGDVRKGEGAGTGGHVLHHPGG